jgi:hypothetical protein
MEDNSEISDLCEVKTSSIEVEAILRICETVVPALSLEPGITGVLSRFYPPEEGFECKINTHLSILKNLRMNLFQFGSFTFPLGQDLVCLIQGDRTLALLPRILPQCKSIVIDPPADLKRLL